MLNRIELEGKVLSAWIANKGGLIIKVAVKHEHRIGNEVIVTESVFKAIFNDLARISMIDVVAGDKVRIIGHLYLNHTATHETLQLFADEIELLS